MPDEPPRSPSGHQRRPTDAPAWWADLERADLPVDTVVEGPDEPRRRRRGQARPPRGAPPPTVLDATELLPGGRRWHRVFPTGGLAFGLALLLAVVAWAAAGGRAWHLAAVGAVILSMAAAVGVMVAGAVRRRPR